MFDESTLELASLYVAGSLPAAEKAEFEAHLRQNDGLRRLTTDLLEVATEALLTYLEPVRLPAPQLRASICDCLFPEGYPHDFLQSLGVTNCEALVITDRDGLIRWINPAFSRMCGYTLEELQGRKAGPVLQGPLTEPGAVCRLREAILAGRPVVETLVNYHKNGTPYQVMLSISPIYDATAAVRGFVAIERENPDWVAGARER